MLKSVQAMSASSFTPDGVPISLPLGSKGDYANVSMKSRHGHYPLVAEAVNAPGNNHPGPLPLEVGRATGCSPPVSGVRQAGDRRPVSTPPYRARWATPPPVDLPFGLTCNISWILTDYSEETGTFAMVPGSHRYCRHPGDMEQPQIMGGPNENICVPVAARPGSLIVFNGNTWHGSWPKKDEGFRAHVVTAFCRNYIIPGEGYDDASPALVETYGDDIAHLFARDTWQTYKVPDHAPDLVALRRAHVTPSA